MKLEFFFYLIYLGGFLLIFVFVFFKFADSLFGVGLIKLGISLGCLDVEVFVKFLFLLLVFLLMMLIFLMLDEGEGIELVGSLLFIFLFLNVN